MSSSVQSLPSTSAPVVIPWRPLAWFLCLLVLCYAPVLQRLALQWYQDEDMGHGFFVPLVAAYIVWQRRRELLAEAPLPNWWGLLVVAYGAFQLIIATLGAELFLARTAFIISLAGGANDKKICLLAMTAKKNRTIFNRRDAERNTNRIRFNRDREKNREAFLANFAPSQLQIRMPLVGRISHQPFSGNPILPPAPPTPPPKSA